MREAEDPIAVEDAPFRLRSVAVTAYGPTVLEGIGYGAAIPIVPLLARQVGAGVGVAAFVAALLGVGQLLTSLPAGSLIARFGERRAMVLASALGAAAAAAAGLAPNVVALGAATVVIGMTWSIFLLARQGFMIDAVPIAMRARALSALGGSHRVGMFLGPLTAAPVIGRFGARSAFAVAVVASLCALVLVLRVPDLGVEARAVSAHEPATMWQVLAAHRHTLATLGLGVLLISGQRALRLTLLPLWADHIGLAAEQVSLLFAATALLEIVMVYPAGAVMDHYGRVFVAVPTVALLGAGMAVLPLTRDFLGVLLVGLAMAAGNGLGSGIVMTLGADTAPVLHRAKYLGGWRLCGDLGISGGPLLVSALMAALTLAATCTLIGAVGLAATPWVGYWVARLDRSRRARPNA